MPKGFHVVCLEPGADNPKKHAPVPAPEPPEGFIDNTVYRYKLDEDGNKVLIGTMEAFPEGWDDPAKRKMTPGSRWENQKEDEKIMARYHWKALWPQAQELLAQGLSTAKVAEKLGIDAPALRCKIDRERRKAERQAPSPEPAAAANQEPERESQEPAETSITPEETKEVTLPPKNDGFGPGDDEPIPYVPVDLRDLIAELREDLDLERKKVAALEKKMELLASALPAGSRTSQENRLAKLLVAVFREIGDAGTA